MRRPKEPARSRPAKIVSIPVRFINSEEKEEKRQASSSAADERPTKAANMDAGAATVMIQKIARGFLARKNARALRSLEAQVEAIERSVKGSEGFLRADAKERIRVSEALMSLLFRLDSIRGARDYRRRVIRRAIALQEALDAIAAADNGAEETTGADGNKSDENKYDDDDKDISAAGEEKEETPDTSRESTGSGEAPLDGLQEIPMDSGEPPVDGLQEIPMDSGEAPVDGLQAIPMDSGEAPLDGLQASTMDSAEAPLDGLHEIPMDSAAAPLDDLQKTSMDSGETPLDGLLEISTGSVEECEQLKSLPTDRSGREADVGAEERILEEKSSEDDVRLSSCSGSQDDADEGTPETGDESMECGKISQDDPRRENSPDSVGERMQSPPSDEGAKTTGIVDGMVEENRALRKLVVDLCEKNEIQCRLMSGLLERVGRLEQTVEKRERRRKRQACDAKRTRARKLERIWR